MTEHVTIGSIFRDEPEGHDDSPIALENQPEEEPQDQGAPELSVGQQMIGSLIFGARQGARRFNELRKRKGGLIHRWFTYDPPSVEQQIAYRDGRSWVIPGYEGGGHEKAGVIYQNWVAIPAISLLNIAIWLFSRGTRLAIAAIITGFLTTITLIIWVATQIFHP